MKPGVATEAVLRLLSGMATAAQLAQELGVAEAEVLRWRELYLDGARVQLRARSQPGFFARLCGRASAHRSLILSCVTLAVVGVVGGWSSGVFSQTLTLKTFTAGTPAVADDINSNFSILKGGIEALNARVGPAFVGDGGRLQINPTAAYAEGTEIVGNRILPGSRSILRLRSTGGAGTLWLDGDVIVNRERTLYIQTDNVTQGLGQPTVIGGDVVVRGNLDARGNRLIVQAPFQGSFAAGAANNSVEVDPAKFESLCTDGDGCTVTLVMRDFFTPAGVGSRDASGGPRHIEFDRVGRTFQASSINGLEDQFGTDNNTTNETIMSAHACALTDGQYAPGGGPLPDSSNQVWLTSLNMNGWTPDCVAIIDD